jgi:hypothetical protein
MNKFLLVFLFSCGGLFASEMSSKSEARLCIASFLNSYIHQKCTVDINTIYFPDHSNKSKIYALLPCQATEIITGIHEMLTPEDIQALKNTIKQASFKALHSEEVLSLQTILYDTFIKGADMDKNNPMLLCAMLNRALYQKLWLTSNPEQIMKALKIPTYTNLLPLHKVIMEGKHIDSKNNK